MEKDEINKSKADTIGPPKSNADEKWLANTADELSALLRSLTYYRSLSPDDLQRLSGELAQVQVRLEELAATAAQRPLSAAEADELRGIKDHFVGGHFEIKDRRIVVRAQDALAVDVAPIPWKHWEKHGILFPKKSSPKTSISWATLESGEHVVSMTADLGNKTVTHRGFIPADVSEKDLPKFGELTNKIYLTSIFFQKAQIRQTNSVTWPHVTKGELLKFLGYNEKQRTRGGKILELIDLAFMTLAYFTFEIKDKKSNRVEEIGNILNWRRDMEGRGFYFKLNDEHTNLILALLQGEKTGGRYFSYPRWLLLENMTPAKRGIFEGLISLGRPQRPCSILIKTILIKWAGLSKAEAKKKDSFSAMGEFLNPILNEAQDKELIKDYKTDPKSVKGKGNNPLEWKILFSFHHKKKHFKVDPDLLAAMMELWGQPTLFDNQEEAEKRRKKKRGQFTGTQTTYGPDAVRRIFDETKEAGEAAFWRKVKGIEEAGAE